MNAGISTQEEQRLAKIYGPRSFGHHWTGTPWDTHQTCSACRTWSISPNAKRRCPKAWSEIDAVFALGKFFTAICPDSPSVAAAKARAAESDLARESMRR